MPERRTVKLNLSMKGGFGGSLVLNKVVVLVNETLNEACFIVAVDITEQKAEEKASSLKVANRFCVIST